VIPLIRLLLVTVLSISCAAAAEKQAPSASETAQPEFTLSIHLVRDVVKVGQPVRLKITTKNISDRSIGIFRDIGGRDELNPLYAVTVWNTNGSSAPETNVKRQKRGHSILFPLEAGKESSIFVDLAKLYNLNRPGLYRVQVEEFEWEKVLVPPVKSDVITFSVVE